MVLVDTSVWVDHLNHGDSRLASILQDRRVLAHPFVVGELALGNLRQRELIIGDLQSLPQATVASDDEVLALIAGGRLFGLGIGYVDAHLLAATKLTAGASLWTRDRRLSAVTRQLGLSPPWE